MERGRAFTRARCRSTTRTHVIVGPLVLAFLSPVAALAWAAHIAIDRAAGYGLRDRDGYQR